MLRTFVVALLCIATSDISAKETAQIAELDPSSDKGILVVSLTMPVMEGAYTQYAGQKYHYRNLARSKLSTKTILLYRKMLFKKEVQSDFEDQFGVLQIIELPAGQYAFEGWTFLNGTGAEYRPTDFGSHPFEIKPGRATYVGQLDLVTRTGDNVFGGQVAVEPVVEFRDATKRDLAVLKRKLPSIGPDQIDISLLTTAEGQTPETKSTIPIPFVVPSQ